jgi:hypothetical protein
MKKLIAAASAMAVTVVAGYAQTNIYQVDWGVGNPADGTAQVVVPPSLIDLTNPDANVTFMGQVWGTRPGIFQLSVENEGDSSFHIQDMLCVELTQGTGNATYGYRDLAGYVGYLADQIPNVIDNPDPDNDKAAALALATWKLEYDAYDPTTMTVNLTGLSFSTGELQYVRTNESVAEYDTILGYANGYIADVQALTPAQAATYAYRYYANPSNDVGAGYQDYITATSVPSPVAVIPFLTGILVALRRRKR